MLQRAMKELKGDRILARDGPIGLVGDVYFDDERWTVRYLLVDTGYWLPGKEVLIAPASIEPERSTGKGIAVNLTREQIEKAPDAESDQPVSRRFAEAHAQYYGYPYYWEGTGLWGAAPVPAAMPKRGREADRQVAAALHHAEKAARETHLRSGREVASYGIEAADGKIGHVEDLLVDDRDWSIRQMVVDTRNWLPGGKHALVPPSAVEWIDWETRTVRVRLTKDEIRQAPELSA